MAERLYKVIFTDSDGKTVIAEQELKKGQDATAPEAPAKEGHEFTGWDRSFTNVTRDIVVKAVYYKTL
ncbi:MAG: InlB B-repeat-containing protein [Butyribacter sp.]